MRASKNYLLLNYELPLYSVIYVHVLIFYGEFQILLMINKMFLCYNYIMQDYIHLVLFLSIIVVKCFNHFKLYRLTSSADSAIKKPWVAFSIFILLPGLIARVLSLPSSCLTSIANSNSFNLEKHNLSKSF